MNDRWSRGAGSLGAALCAGWLLVGCEEPSGRETLSCDGISQCPLGQACDAITRRCVPEPIDGLQGKFSCVLLGSNPDLEPVLDLGEVVGTVDGEHWSFVFGGCKVLETSERTAIAFEIGTLANGSRELTILADREDVAEGVVRLHAPTVVPEIGMARVWDLNTGFVEGYARSGSVLVVGEPEEGNTLEGYVQLALDLVPDDLEVEYSRPCPRGIVDCGARSESVLGATNCYPVRDAALCTRACEADAECELGGGACIDGICARACSDDDDCTSPLECRPWDDTQGTEAGCF